jgi:DNA-binding HxlR family transcriptional regulator
LNGEAGWPERNETDQSFRQFRRFHHVINSDKVFSTDRLKKLVRFGVLRKIPYQDAPKRYEYILTQKGLDLYPIIMSIVHWGNVHMVDSRGRPLLHEHKSCQKMFDPSWSARNVANR